MKCHKNMKLSGHEIKVKIAEYFSDDSAKPGNSQEQRLSKSCPPVQATTTGVTPHQMGAPIHHQAPSSAFKPSSAFQPFNRRPSQNDSAQEQQHERKDSINKNTFGNHGSQSINLSNQVGQMKANLAYPDSYNQ